MIEPEKVEPCFNCGIVDRYCQKKIEEELERVREEIRIDMSDIVNNSCDYTIGMAKSIEIIDNHISELKGEEKTGKWVWDWSISCECPKYICSVCGESVWLKTDRCPKCKAIMKGDNK